MGLGVRYCFGEKNETFRAGHNSGKILHYFQDINTTSKMYYSLKLTIIRWTLISKSIFSSKMKSTWSLEPSFYM